MKPKKAKKLLNKLDAFLEKQSYELPFVIGLSDDKRKEFVEYAKGLLIKENKKNDPTFTQPKEVGEKSVSNSIDIIKIIPFFIVDGGASGIIHYKRNGTCDIHINKGVCNARISIDNHFIIERVIITNDSIIKLIGDSVTLSRKGWKQEGNTLVIL